MNENWARWIFASISEHFKGNLGALALYVEGQFRDIDDDNFVELRIDGPNCTEISKDCWKLYVEVNALIQCKMSDTNFHTLQTNIGKVTSIFTNIEVFKYGDDDSHVGCLVLQQDSREKIQASNFGKIEPDIDILQATVEGHYVMILEV